MRILRSGSRVQLSRLSRKLPRKKRVWCGTHKLETLMARGTGLSTSWHSLCQPMRFTSPAPRPRMPSQSKDCNRAREPKSQTTSMRCWARVITLARRSEPCTWRGTILEIHWAPPSSYRNRLQIPKTQAPRHSSPKSKQNKPKENRCLKKAGCRFWISGENLAKWLCSSVKRNWRNSFRIRSCLIKIRSSKLKARPGEI